MRPHGVSQPASSASSVGSLPSEFMIHNLLSMLADKTLPSAPYATSTIGRLPEVICCALERSWEGATHTLEIVDLVIPATVPPPRVMSRSVPYSERSLVRRRVCPLGTTTSIVVHDQRLNHSVASATRLRRPAIRLCQYQTHWNIALALCHLRLIPHPISTVAPFPKETPARQSSAHLVT